MFNSSSEVLSPCLRRFVLSGCLVPNLWEDGRLSLTPWSLFLSLLLFPLRENWSTWTSRLCSSWHVCPSGCHRCIFFLKESTSALAHGVFSSLENPGKILAHLSTTPTSSAAMTFPLLNLAKPCWVLSWPLGLYSRKERSVIILTSHKIFILFFALFSYHVGALPANFPFLPGKDTYCVYL